MGKSDYLFSDSEAYHEQMGPIPSSNGSLDIALSECILRVQLFTYVIERQCHYCTMIEARTQRPLLRARENWQSTSYNFSFLLDYVQFWVFPNVIRGGGEDH